MYNSYSKSCISVDGLNIQVIWYELKWKWKYFVENGIFCGKYKFLKVKKLKVIIKNESKFYNDTFKLKCFLLYKLSFFTGSQGVYKN